MATKPDERRCSCGRLIRVHGRETCYRCSRGRGHADAKQSPPGHEGRLARYAALADVGRPLFGTG